jgi:hypothetical protein
MGLLDDLRDASKSLDPSEQPSANETSAVLGSVVHFLEHGPAFLAAAADGPQAVSDLLAGDSAPKDDAPKDHGAASGGSASAGKK